MNGLIRHIVVLAVCIILMNDLRGQTGVRMFEQIGIENGLSSNYTNCIIQDSIGFIWIGTNHGLNRYDGYQSKTYLNDIKDTTSISNNWINSVLQDSQGNIWIGTEGGGLNLYDRSSDSFHSYQSDSAKKNSIGSNTIICLYEDSQERIWIGTQNGLTLLDKDDYTFRNYTDYKDCFDCNKSITSINEDYKGNLWIGDEVHGIFYFDTKRETFSTPHLKKDNQTELKSSFINDLLYEHPLLWIGTDNGLELLNTDKNELENIAYQSDDNHAFDNYVMKIYKVDSSEMLICTNGSGVVSYNQENNNLKLYNSDLFSPYGLSSNSVADAIIDRSRNLWIATRAGGVNKFNLKSLTFKHWNNKPDNSNSLIQNEVRAMYQDKNGTIWIGTNNGLSKYDQEKDQFINYQEDFTYREDLSTPRIRLIFRSLDQNLWVTTQSGGLYRYLPKQDKFLLEQAYVTSPATTDMRDIRCYFEKEPGVLWLGTTGTGLVEYNLKEGTVTRVGDIKAKNDHLAKQTINCLTLRNENQIWLGTEQGLMLLDIATLNYKKWSMRRGYNIRTSLAGNKVRSLYQDKEENLWIGTRSGLSYLDVAKDSLTTFTYKDGLPSDIIFGIMPGTNDDLWLTTPNGLSQVNVNTMKFNNIKIPQNNSLDMGGYSPGLNGEMLVGGTAGFTIFDPNDLKINPHIPNVVFTDFKIDNESVVLDRDISEIDTLVLSHEQKNLTFIFSALEYTNSKSNQYQYCLDGFNEGWIDYGTKHDVTFTNLTPGKYTLKVRGSNNDGLWNQQEARLFILITPPWWGRLYFRIGAILLILLLAYAFYFYKTYAYNVRQKRLKREVRERTKQLSLANDQLNKQNEQLEKALEKLKNTQSQLVQSEKMASLGLLTAGVAHELNNPLNFVKNGVQGLIEYIKRLQIQDSEEFLNKMSSVIQTGVDRSTKLVQSLNHFSRKNDIMDEDCDIHAILDNCVLMLQNHSNAEISIKKHYTETAFDLKGNESGLHQVFLNLISNAIQSIESVGIVSISTAVEKDSLEIKIEDNGSGIPEEYIDKITDPFFTTKDPGKGTGLGVSIAYQIISQHKGLIKYSSEADIGTLVTVRLPLRKKRGMASEVNGHVSNN